MGRGTADLERFAAIQDENGRIVVFDVAFAANGAINTATAVSALNITGGPDFEGIAYTGVERNSVFVSEENSPKIREFKLDGGGQLQSISLPEVYSNFRSNRSLEALTRSLDGSTMWTANEEALDVDGPDSSPTQTNVVRLQSLTDDGEHVTLGSQFAYLVDPIHAGSGSGNDRSGLPDLAVLPDGALVALERSAASTLPPFRSRIYQIDFADATDIGGVEFEAGLEDATYTPVKKSLLWSGAVGTLTNGNMEGLGLGPRLANGNWTMVGVLDNGGSGSNLVMSFELSLTGCTIAGDFNCSGVVDQTDFEFWKSLYGTSRAGGGWERRRGGRCVGLHHLAECSGRRDRIRRVRRPGGKRDVDRVQRVYRVFLWRRAKPQAERMRQNERSSGRMVPEPSPGRRCRPSRPGRSAASRGRSLRRRRCRLRWRRRRGCRLAKELRQTV